MSRFNRNPVISDDDIGAIVGVLKKGTLTGFRGAPGDAFLGGDEVRGFEAEVARYFGVKYAVSCNSGTSALHMACAALVDSGEVLVSPFTFSASAKCALYIGATPVFVDITEDTFTMNPDLIEEKITEKTKAIIPVHLCGHPADMNPIMNIARKYGLKVIEDSAQAFGSVYKGQFTGTIGDCGIFSFGQPKFITTLGEGGMVITNNDDLAYKLQGIRNHGEMLQGKILGYNLRLTEAAAAMGRSQFKRIDFFNSMRVSLANHLTERIRYFKGITPPLVKNGCKHVYYTYPIKVERNRDEIVSLLNNRGVYMGAGYNRPLHLLPIFGGKMGDCPVAEEMFFKRLMVTDIVRYPQKPEDMDFFADTLGDILRELNS